MDAEAVERLVAKLRQFIVTELDEDERAVLAALLAPGVAAAYGAGEVTGFGAADAAPFPEVLAEGLERAGIRVVGLERPA